MLGVHHWSMWRFAWRSTTGPKRMMLPVVGIGLVARFGVASVRHRMGGQQAEVPG